MVALSELNALAAADAREALLRCCGARRWAEGMVAARPFRDEAALCRAAQRVWATCGEADWLEAFAAHPKIGDRTALERRYAGAWAAGEQAGAVAATADVLEALAAENARYEERFGFIFIVCATGKSAPEMLELLRARIDNDRATELRNAAAEQGAITRLRLGKLVRRGEGDES